MIVFGIFCLIHPYATLLYGTVLNAFDKSIVINISVRLHRRAVSIAISMAFYCNASWPLCNLKFSLLSTIRFRIRVIVSIMQIGLTPPSFFGKKATKLRPNSGIFSSYFGSFSNVVNKRANAS